MENIEERKKGRQEERKKGRKEERKKGRKEEKEERKKGRKEERKKRKKRKKGRKEEGEEGKKGRREEGKKGRREEGKKERREERKKGRTEERQKGRKHPVDLVLVHVRRGLPCMGQRASLALVFRREASILSLYALSFLCFLTSCSLFRSFMLFSMCFLLFSCLLTYYYCSYYPHRLCYHVASTQKLSDFSVGIHTLIGKPLFPLHVN